MAHSTVRGHTLLLYATCVAAAGIIQFLKRNRRPRAYLYPSLSLSAAITSSMPYRIAPYRTVPYRIVSYLIVCRAGGVGCSAFEPSSSGLTGAACLFFCCTSPQPACRLDPNMVHDFVIIIIIIMIVTIAFVWSRPSLLLITVWQLGYP